MSLLPSIKSRVSQKMLEKYTVDSKFIQGQDINREIMTYAMGLEDGQKASMIFVIGGHAVDV